LNQGTPHPDLQANNPADESDNHKSESESERPKRGKQNSEHTIQELSQYEIPRAANIARNKVLVDEVDEQFRAQYGGLLPEIGLAPPKPEQKKREKKKKDEGKDQGPLRHSTRNNQEQ
jgi:hypothetical protein